jgi:hypothetical protein
MLATNHPYEMRERERLQPPFSDLGRLPWGALINNDERGTEPLPHLCLLLISSHLPSYPLQ